MKKIFAVIMIICLFGAAACHSQEVVFEKFKIGWSPYNNVCPSDMQYLYFNFRTKSDKSIKTITVYYHEETQSGEIVRDKFGKTEFYLRIKWEQCIEDLADIVESYPELLKIVPHTIVIKYHKPLEYFDDEYDDKVIPITDKNIKYYFPDL